MKFDLKIRSYYKTLPLVFAASLLVAFTGGYIPEYFFPDNSEFVVKELKNPTFTSEDLELSQLNLSEECIEAVTMADVFWESQIRRAFSFKMDRGYFPPELLLFLGNSEEAFGLAELATADEYLEWYPTPEQAILEIVLNTYPTLKYPDPVYRSEMLPLFENCADLVTSL